MHRSAIPIQNEKRPPPEGEGRSRGLGCVMGVERGGIALAGLLLAAPDGGGKEENPAVVGYSFNAPESSTQTIPSTMYPLWSNAYHLPLMHRHLEQAHAPLPSQ